MRAMLLAVVLITPATLRAEAPSPTALQSAVKKSLPLLEKGARGHRDNRSCFACHNQGIPLMALISARSRGFDIDEDEVDEQVKFIHRFLNKNRENYKLGKGQGGQIDTAGYALWTLEKIGHKSDAVTDAVSLYFLTHQNDMEHYKPTSVRPPSEGSPFTSSYLALHGLQVYGGSDLKDRIDKRREKVGAWLVKTPVTSTEDRVFRLWGLKWADVPSETLRTAVQDLRDAQRTDGGWSQLENLDSDAYATGSALVALHEAGGLATTDPVYERGLKFLLEQQRDDGSWFIKSRSKPFQTYYESGFPHGKNQFISMAGSAWATLAMTLALPPVAPKKLEPELAKNDDVLDRLKELKEGEGVVLGKAQVIGDFNETAKRFDLHKTGPMGRDFTIRMLWMPDRKRALFLGANHGVPHRLNDVWEFDLASLTWVMLYAPDNARDYTGLGKDARDVEFKDGTFITKRGGPGIIAHTWWGLAYDPKLKAALFMNTWVTDQKKAATQLGGNPEDVYAGPPLWSFTPSTKQWKFLKTEKPFPRPIFGGMLEYVPELGGTIWHANNWQMQSTWLYDARTNSWKDLKANGASKDFGKEAAEPEQVSYYDASRKLVIAQRHKATSYFDPKNNAWTKVLDKEKEADDVPFGHDARSPMYYDPKSGHGLLFEFQTNTLWAYDPDKTSWKALDNFGEPAPKGNKRLAYFDAEHGVFVVIHGTTVWVYRYRS